MKIATVVQNSWPFGPPTYNISICGQTMNFVDTESSAKIRCNTINAALEPLFLRFGSLVREEAAKTCDNPDGSSYLSDAIRSISLPALLEKMGEGV